MKWHSICRVGRLLVTFLLCERQVLLKPVLYLSYFFKRYRQQYYEHLQAVRDTGAWEDWLQFFLRGVVEVSGQATETARRILSLREQHRLAITEKLGRAAANGYRVLEHLYQHPIVSVNEVQALIGTTYPAANDLVARLVECGILTEITGQQRNRRYMYQSRSAIVPSTLSTEVVLAVSVRALNLCRKRLEICASDQVQAFHLINRCVRRTYLCGKDRCAGVLSAQQSPACGRENSTGRGEIVVG